MKISAGVDFFSFGVEKILKKYGEWFLKMCWNPVLVISLTLFFSLALTLMEFGPILTNTVA